MTTVSIHLEQVCNSAERGLEVARAVLEALNCERIVHLNASETVRMTPSFINALVFTVMAEHPNENFRCRVHFIDASPLVSDQLATAVSRFTRGIRLSSQRVAVRHTH